MHASVLFGEPIDNEQCHPIPLQSIEPAPFEDAVTNVNASAGKNLVDSQGNAVRTVKAYLRSGETRAI